MKKSKSCSGVKALVCSVMSLVALLLCSHMANAAIYDDFNDGNLDKWTFLGSGLFSEHDSRLYFDGASSSGTQVLISNPLLNGGGRVSLEFYNFSSTNNSPSGQQQSATVQLIIGTATNNTSVMIGHNTFGTFLEFDRTVNGNRSLLQAVGTTLTEGMLCLHYEGNNVSAFYSAGITTPNWIQIGPTVSAPAYWALVSPVPVLVYGGTGGSGQTTFQIDNVAYSSVPIPSAFLLLGPGLAGIAVLRRRFKKSSIPA